MTGTYVEVTLDEIFTPQAGSAKFILDYMDKRLGDYPVYSAGLTRPFGFVDEFEYDGQFLTWVMNGYGGRVREVKGKFSVNRDRGVLVPVEGVVVPDLTYLKFALEPQMTAAAAGRRVDGRLNEYTKIYPPDAAKVVVRLPTTDDGDWDHERMRQIGDRLRRIEIAQIGVASAASPLQRAVFPIVLNEPRQKLSLGDPDKFELSIGKRVLKKDHATSGVPVYSANALIPFGHVVTSNLTQFDGASLLWGIDGNFDWNYMEEDVVFATTDHCGRLRVLDEQLDPFYVYCYLKSTRETYGFDRVFRASLGNMRANVEVEVPLGDDGEPSLETQQKLAADYKRRTEARLGAIAALSDVMQARLTTEL